LSNTDGLYCWDNALSLLRLKNSWENNTMNLKMIKKTIAPAVVYLTAPLLVVGISKIEFTPIISHDVSCVLQDPTGNYNTFFLANSKLRIVKHISPCSRSRRSERANTSRCYHGLWETDSSG